MNYTEPARKPLVLGVLFGLLSALGPLAIDFYLPAFPAVAQDLATNPAMVKLSLSLFFLALALGPVIYGTLSDRLGRRPLLFWAMGIFVLTSLACSAAPSIRWLLLGRFLQGLGASGMTTISRAMIRDLARGHKAVQLLAFAFLVQGVSPILAPVAGGLSLTFMSWRGLFLVMCGMTLIAALLVYFVLPETHEQHQRVESRNVNILSIYRAVLGNRRFVLMSLIAGCSSGGTFTYLTGSPFLFAHVFHQPPTHFSVMIAIAAGTYIAGIQGCPHLVKRFGIDRHLSWTTLAATILALLLTAVALLGMANLAVFMSFLILLSTCFGLMVTPAAIGGMDAVKAHGGTAAAVLATIQLLCATIASATISVLPEGSVLPIAATMLVCVVLATAAIRICPPSQH